MGFMDFWQGGYKHTDVIRKIPSPLGERVRERVGFVVKRAPISPEQLCRLDVARRLASLRLAYFRRLPALRYTALSSRLPTATTTTTTRSSKTW